MRISVIVPVHNAEAYLAQTVGSALDQSVPPLEILLIDDGSTDGSLALAQRLAAGAPDRIRVWSQAQSGAAATRNRGADLASGDALMFLDADDLMAPDTLAALATALESQPGAAIAACPWRRLDKVGADWVTRPASCRPRRPDPLSGWLTGWYYPPCALLWSRTAYRQTGGWDEAIGVNDDGDLMMRALILGVPLIETVAGRSYYRRLPQGQTSLSGQRYSRRGLQDRLAVLDKIRHWLDEAGRLPAYADPLAEAYRRLAREAPDHADLARIARQRAGRLGLGPYWRDLMASGRARLRRLRRPSPRTGPRKPAGDGRPVRLGEAHAAALLSAHPTALQPTALAPAAPVPKPPLVSVVIPSYNRPAELRRALASVLAQDVEDLEILVIDDASTEDTESAATGFGDPRIRFLRQPHNGGVAAARNRGLQESRAPFIALLDDDDEWLPGKLTKQLACLQAGPPDLGLVYGSAEDVDTDGRTRFHPNRAEGQLYRKMLSRNRMHGAPSSLLMRRNIVRQIGFFDPRLPAIEDYDYFLRACRVANVACLPDALIRYYDPRDPKTDPDRRSRNRAANRLARQMFFEKHRRAMAEAEVTHLFLTDSVRRYLKYPDGDRAIAVRTLWQALRARPVHRPALRLALRLAVQSPPAIGRSAGGAKL